MEFYLNWILIVSIVGIAIGVFFIAIILGTKKDKREIQVLLSLLILALTLSVFGNFSYMINLLERFPYHLLLILAIPYLFGPLLYIYVLSATASEFRFQSKHLFHFIPFILYMVSWLPYYSALIQFYIQSQQDYIRMLIRPLPLVYIDIFLRFIHFMIYMILSVRVIRNYHRVIENAYSSVEKIRLKWLNHLILIFGFISLLHLVYNCLAYFIRPFFHQLDHFLQLPEPIVICILGYRGLTQTHILYDASSFKIDTIQKQLLTDEKKTLYKRTLLDYMKNERPYLISDLTLNDLSEQLSISQRSLSYILNVEMKQTFYEFINRYRIEEAKQKLLKPENRKFTILSLAFESGFQSKSTFNSLFKKYVSMTPSQYQKITFKNKSS